MKKGKDIISEVAADGIPNMDALREKIIAQATNKSTHRRNLWVKRTATVAVCFVLVFSMLLALPVAWYFVRDNDGETSQSTTQPEPPALNFPNITTLTARAPVVFPEGTIESLYSRNVFFDLWGGPSLFSLPVVIHFNAVSLQRQINFSPTTTICHGEWNEWAGNLEWSLWIRVFDEETMVKGSQYGGEWKQIPIHLQRTVTSTYHFEGAQRPDRRNTVGFVFSWHTLGEERFTPNPGVGSFIFRNAVWNYDMIDLQRGVTYEYMISAMRDGENYFTSFSEMLEISEVQFEAISLFRELYEISGLDSARPYVESERRINFRRNNFMSDNFLRFVSVNNEFRYMFRVRRCIWTSEFSRYSHPPLSSIALMHEPIGLARMIYAYNPEAYLYWLANLSSYEARNVIDFVLYFQITREEFIKYTVNEYNHQGEFDPERYFSSEFIDILFSGCRRTINEYFVNPNALLIDGEIIPLGWFRDATVEQILAFDYEHGVLLDYWVHLEQRVASNLLHYSILDDVIALALVVHSIKNR